MPKSSNSLSPDSFVNKTKVEDEIPQFHLSCKRGNVAENVILSGDPQRIELFSNFLDEISWSYRGRGFVLFTGKCRKINLTLASTGIGAPSTAIVIEELANVGAKNFIRVGTTGAIQPFIEIGDFVLPIACYKGEGTSKYYVPPEYPAVATYDLFNLLVKHVYEYSLKNKINYHVGIVATNDAFYRETPDLLAKLANLNILSLDMETSILFTIGSVKRLSVSSLLYVNGNLIKGREPFIDASRISKNVWRDIFNIVVNVFEEHTSL